MRRTLMLLFALSACATTQNESARHADLDPNDPNVECHEEKPAGSNIGREVCRRKDDEDANRDATQRGMQRPVPAKPPPSGGN